MKYIIKWTTEIMVHLAGEGFNNTALSEMYLPGYYLQMDMMKKAFQKKDKEINDKGEDYDEQIYKQD